MAVTSAGHQFKHLLGLGADVLHALVAGDLPATLPSSWRKSVLNWPAARRLHQVFEGIVDGAL